MQRGTHPDDIHAILGRFSAWTGRQPGNGTGAAIAGDGVREISYDEAMRNLRSRRTARSPEVVHPGEPAMPEPDPGSAVPAPPAIEENRPKISAKTLARKAVVTSKLPARNTQTKAGAQSAVARPRARKTKTEHQVEFREVLSHRVRQQSAAGPGLEKNPERTRRVSVRLSEAEERRLQERAQQAGVTVSEYLRGCALPATPARPPANALPAVPKKQLPMRSQAAPAAQDTAHSSFGDWIALLRNRFLASPRRFAERA